MTTCLQGGQADLYLGSKQASLIVNEFLFVNVLVFIKVDIVVSMYQTTRPFLGPND